MFFRCFLHLLVSFTHRYLFIHLSCKTIFQLVNARCQLACNFFECSNSFRLRDCEVIQSRYENCDEYDVNCGQKNYERDKAAASTRVIAFLHVCRTCLARRHEGLELFWCERAPIRRTVWLIIVSRFGKHAHVCYFLGKLNHTKGLDVLELLTLIGANYKYICPVVQKVDNAIQWTNAGKTNYACYWLLVCLVHPLVSRCPQDKRLSWHPVSNLIGLLPSYSLIGYGEPYNRQNTLRELQRSWVKQNHQ